MANKSHNQGKLQLIARELMLTPGVKKVVATNAPYSALSRLRNLGLETSHTISNPRATTGLKYDRYEITAWYPEPHSTRDFLTLAIEQQRDQLKREVAQRELINAEIAQEELRHRAAMQELTKRQQPYTLSIASLKANIDYDNQKLALMVERIAQEGTTND